LLFRELFHMVHSMRSGRHHPDGVLWVRTGRHRVELEKVSLRDIAPTVLEFFGVSTPPSMQGTTLNCLQPAGEATPVAI
jgi:bisphosphoglycerate-independent phosphoglycerate mutase (AlkP superfamily)